ncbi:exonuclease subunit SbcD [Siphonobacter sp. SORGH_AS_1065]|uniref:exonuclease subunit SbcD n=1 Tax=Siphonobacter sp. SORGH_AS_1065 TaxID=3041795 RepID=UPI002783F649|nr:exonuclease subunit SbcD [Siphonobacter sp. SORGH_AS_1065]MDQ1087037.1 exonuclease SbcD [Siphonobacter sp. SORGH_AS_1065]
MKILHTADWHLGKRLYQTDLLEDSRRFVDWLLQTIEERQIDVLLVAGDIFDTANPSTEAMQVYYDFLRKLIRLKCRLIITGGNHDSAAVLNGPRELLALLDVHVIGGACDDCHEEVLPLLDRHGKLQAAVAAVPFLRDRDLKRSVEGETFEDRRMAVRAGIQRRYDQVHAHGRKTYADVPLLGMGHLFVNGSATSDNDEKLHSIGTLDLFEVSLFPAFDYLALGHIHRPQMLGKKEYVRYSGSPVALSFSERLDEKLVIHIEIKNNKVIDIQEINVPKFRQLRRFRGAFTEIETLLNSYQHSDELSTLAEIEIHEEHRDPALIDQAKAYFLKLNHSHLSVLNWRFKFQQQLKTTDELFGETMALPELAPAQVFEQWLQENASSDESKVLLTEAFHELMNSVQ